MQKIGILDVSKVYRSMFQDLSSFETASQSVILYHRFDKFVFILDLQKKNAKKKLKKQCIIGNGNIFHLNSSVFFMVNHDISHITLA